MPLADDVNLEELAAMTEGYTGADIEGVCREAGMISLRESFEANEVRKDHFVAALKDSYPSIDDEMMEYYKQMDKRLNRGLIKRDMQKGIEVM
jgi:transitional endoplasmic reticulum ATPase